LKWVDGVVRHSQPHAQLYLLTRRISVVRARVVVVKVPRVVGGR